VGLTTTQHPATPIQPVRFHDAAAAQLRTDCPVLQPRTRSEVTGVHWVSQVRLAEVDTTLAIAGELSRESYFTLQQQQAVRTELPYAATRLNADTVWG
jgi:hypothetical protein